ncbi:hypothetical protein NMG60_11034138 [Bertholletia excelsa]
MLELGGVLHSRGFSIIVAHASLNSPNPSNHPDFVFLPLSGGLSDSAAVDHASRNLFDLILDVNVNCKEPLREYLAGEMQPQEADNQVTCIIYDTIMYCAGDVANLLKLPSMVLRTSSASSNLAYMNMPRLHSEGFIPLKDSTLHDLVPEISSLRFKDLPMAHFVPLKIMIQVADMLCKTTSSAIIWNTVDVLEHQSLARFQQQSKVPIFSVGPLHKFATASSTSLLQEDSSCISWLDKQAPGSVLYVSLGSLANVDEKALAEMAWGLANSNQPFLWVIRPGSVVGSEWIELLPENFEKVVGERGYIAQWVPQKRVLAHRAVGGFWSHCGWNSTLESLYAGVPTMCWPFIGDQKVNARYLCGVWGVGLEMEQELERVKIERVVKRIMVDEEGKKIRKRAGSLKKELEVAVSSAHNSLDDLVKFIMSF